MQLNQFVKLGGKSEAQVVGENDAGPNSPHLGDGVTSKSPVICVEESRPTQLSSLLRQEAR